MKTKNYIYFNFYELIATDFLFYRGMKSGILNPHYTISTFENNNAIEEIQDAGIFNLISVSFILRIE